MPYPDYWPDGSQFRPLHWFLEGFNSTAIKEREAVASLADLSGIEAFLTDKYQSNKKYEVAELANSEMWTKIAVQISHTPRHTAGYKQDKYLPARGLKGTPAGPGQTDLKNFQELFGGKRMDVKPGEWGVLLILVCKNQERWAKFEQCRQNFAATTTDATQDMRSMQWATGAKVGNFPVIDEKLGECYLWSGQSLDILHGVMSLGFQRVHCASNATTGYGALGRGSYFTDKFSKLFYTL
jgi:hypothetical protein